MLCKNCGIDLVAGAAYCPGCGKPVVKFSAAEGPATGLSARSGTSLQPNLAGTLCYLAGFITGIFFLITEAYKQDRFVRFHAYQAIFLSIACLGLYFILGIFSAAAPMFWRVAEVLRSLFGLAFLGLWVLLMYKAYHNEEFKLPFIGGWAARQA